MSEMKELSKERIRGHAAVDGDGYQDINDASWSFSDAGLQKFAAAIIKEDRALNAPAAQDRLLAALERAGKAESSLRALANECDNRMTPGWEDRMRDRIDEANRLLAAVPTPPADHPAKTWGYCDARDQPTKVETTYARQHAAHEAELTAMIEERDHREEIIDQLCDAVLGPDRAEWSSNYYFEDAVSEVQERITELETRKECRESNAAAEQGEQEPAPDVLATLRAKVEALPRFSNSPEELYGLISNLAVLALIDKMGGTV